MIFYNFILYLPKYSVCKNIFKKMYFCSKNFFVCSLCFLIIFIFQLLPFFFYSTPMDNSSLFELQSSQCLTWRLCSPRSTLSSPLHPPCGKPVPPDSLQSRTSLRTSRPSSRPCNPAVHFLSFLIQGEQLNMALFFWYLVKSYLSRLR